MTFESQLVDCAAESWQKMLFREAWSILVANIAWLFVTTRLHLRVIFSELLVAIIIPHQDVFESGVFLLYWQLHANRCQAFYAQKVLECCHSCCDIMANSMGNALHWPKLFTPLTAATVDFVEVPSVYCTRATHWVCLHHFVRYYGLLCINSVHWNNNIPSLLCYCFMPWYSAFESLNFWRRNPTASAYERRRCIVSSLGSRKWVFSCPVSLHVDFNGQTWPSTYITVALRCFIAQTNDSNSRTKVW